MKVWSWLGIAMFVGGLSGCGASGQDRLGADGERCLDNSECRDGLLCTSGICGEDERVGGCTDFCAHLEACGQSPEGCLDSCRSTTRRWTDAAYDEFMACVPTVECGAIATGGLDGCLPAVSTARRQTCTDLVDALEVQCNMGADFADTCSVAAATLSANTFASIDRCDPRACESFMDCQDAIW